MADRNDSDARRARGPERGGAGARPSAAPGISRGPERGGAGVSRGPERGGGGVRSELAKGSTRGPTRGGGDPRPADAPRDPTDETKSGPLFDLTEELARSGAPVRLLHYVLLHEIGHGGMGVVFAAYDEKLDRKVAIKILRDHIGEEGQRRLVREGQAMARISHPNVIKIHEIGEHRGRTFIVMEYVDGTTLREWRRNRSNPPEAVVEVFIGAGAGLAAAHAKGIVHRDFKPDNVLVGKDGGVWVLDFGLAREGPDAPMESLALELLGDVSELSSNLTQEGSLLGTPAYMAPEQFSGKIVDAKSDQFSYCVAMWEALYGERPFPTTDFETLADAVTNGKVREPAKQDAPAWLRKIIDRGMQVDPDKRWPDMDALVDELRRDRKRKRKLLIVGAVGLALVGIGVSVPLISSARAEAETQARCEAAGQALSETWNDSVKAELRASFGSSGLAMASSAWAHSVARIDAHAEAWTTLRTELCLETELRGERDQASYELALACLDERQAGLAALLEAWTTADDQTVLGATTAAARLLSPERCVDSKWVAQRSAPPLDTSEQVRVQRRRLERVTAQMYAGKLDVAEREAEAVLGEAQTLAWAPLVAEARLHVGLIQAGRGQYERASETLVEATFEATGSANDLVCLDATTALVDVLGTHLKQPARADYWMHLAERYIERLDLAGGLREAALLHNRAAVLSAAGKHGEALELERAALEIREAELGGQHPLTAQSHDTIGENLAALRELDAALVAHERAVEIYTASLGAEHPDVARALTRAAALRSALGQHDRSLAASREALRILEATLGRDHLDTGATHLVIGEAQAGLGATEAARVALSKAVEIASAHDDLALRAEARFALARTWWATGGRARGNLILDEARADYRALEAEAELAALEAWVLAQG